MLQDLMLLPVTTYFVLMAIAEQEVVFASLFELSQWFVA